MTAKWYIVHAYSNFEQKVARSIQEQADEHGLGDRFEQILVPTEEVVEMRRGQRKVRKKEMFQGYVLVKMELDDATYHLIKNTPKVTGFLGSGKTPIPVSEAEVASIIGHMDESVERPRAIIAFEIGEQVKVNDGPFQSFIGLIEEVDQEKGRVKVAVSIFGRSTPVELEYGQVDKV